MTETVSRHELLESFKNLKDQFSQALNDAQNQDHKFEEIRQIFSKKFAKQLEDARKNIPAKNPMAAQIEGFISLLYNTSHTWNERIGKREKGIGFRANHNDSLLVFVFGKVKSGKSSLGNYIAWGNTDPSDMDKHLDHASLQPHYFSHDQSEVSGGDEHKEAEKRREFRVGATEATSSIQGFNLAGLTWIDSPGLHSLNPKNEQLAKNYVEHADLILYTMKSDAPGRDSDLKEIKDLNNKYKKTLLLITGSDDVEEDWDETTEQIIQKTVMKDVTRRNKQKQSVINELHKILGFSESNNIDVTSISARYAQLNQNDPKCFADSGMGELFSTINILIKTDGLRIKQQAPMANFKNFLESCLDDLKPYHQLMHDFEEPIVEIQKKIPITVRQEVRVAQTIMRSEIDRAFNALEANRHDQSDMQNNIQILQKSLGEYLQKLIADSLNNVFYEVMQDFRSSMVSTFRKSDLAQLPEFKIETAEEQIPLGVNKGTRKRNGGIGALLGAGLGFLAGGPVGSMAGATIGSTLGAMTGGDTTTNMETIKINTGDNFQIIKQSAMTMYIDTLERNIEQKAEELLSTLITDTRKLANELSDEIKTVESNLKMLTHETNKKLDIS